MKACVVAILCMLGCGKGDSTRAETKAVETKAPETKTPTKAVETKAPETKAKPVVEPAPSFDKLAVTVGGKRVPMRRAFVKRVSLDQWRIQVSDLEGSCTELLSGVTNARPGATGFVATIAKHLAPDGTLATMVTELWFGGHPTGATLGTATIAETAAKGSQVPIELGKIVDTKRKGQLAVEGAFTALACGDGDSGGAGIPEAEHVSAASLTIAGHKMELRGAVRHGKDLVLSTGPKDCSTVQPFAQVVLQNRGAHWVLAGTWFSEPSTTDVAKGLTVGFGPKGTSADGPTVSIKLAGAALIGDYPLALAGTIEALDCR